MILFVFIFLVTKSRGYARNVMNNIHLYTSLTNPSEQNVTLRLYVLPSVFTFRPSAHNTTVRVRYGGRRKLQSPRKRSSSLCRHSGHQSTSVRIVFFCFLFSRSRSDANLAWRAFGYFFVTCTITRARIY